MGLEIRLYGRISLSWISGALAVDYPETLYANMAPRWMFEKSFAILWGVYRKTIFQHTLRLDFLERGIEATLLVLSTSPERDRVLAHFVHRRQWVI